MSEIEKFLTPKNAAKNSPAKVFTKNTKTQSTDLPISNRPTAATQKSLVSPQHNATHNAQTKPLARPLPPSSSAVLARLSSSPPPAHSAHWPQDKIQLKHTPPLPVPIRATSLPPSTAQPLVKLPTFPQIVRTETRQIQQHFQQITQLLERHAPQTHQHFLAQLPHPARKDFAPRLLQHIVRFLQTQSFLPSVLAKSDLSPALIKQLKNHSDRLQEFSSQTVNDSEGKAWQRLFFPLFNDKQIQLLRLYMPQQKKKKPSQQKRHPHEKQSQKRFIVSLLIERMGEGDSDRDRQWGCMFKLNFILWPMGRMGGRR